MADLTSSTCEDPHDSGLEESKQLPLYLQTASVDLSKYYLESIDFHGCYVDISMLKYMLLLPNLQELNLDDTKNISSIHISMLAYCRALHTLSLQRTAITGEHIQLCTQLRKLDVAECKQLHIQLYETYTATYQCAHMPHCACHSVILHSVSLWLRLPMLRYFFALYSALPLLLYHLKLHYYVCVLSAF